VTRDDRSASALSTPCDAADGITSGWHPPVQLRLHIIREAPWTTSLSTRIAATVYRIDRNCTGPQE